MGYILTRNFGPQGPKKVSGKTQRPGPKNQAKKYKKKNEK